MEPPTFDEFLKTMLRSGLFTAAEFEAVKQSAPGDALRDSQAMANHLVKLGKLSRFQASKLLEGVTLGLVLGPFHVLAPIGKGGMGAVYLARDSRNQGLIALKVLPPKRAKAQERLLMRFRREMEISQRVIHPHLTRTLEVGVHLGINYIAMEFIPGKNLYKLIQEHGPLKVPRAARMVVEVAMGLYHAHSMGLIHRDLKPSNIMVMPDDQVKVLDLGLALIQGESDTDRTITGGQGYVVGTLDYLAPEQAEDPLKVDARSDIYSLGCTLYFALTGSPPFAGGNALQKMLKHRLDPPKPVCEVNPSVPATFAVLLTRMMAKKPELRFQSALELRDAILTWTGDVPGTIAPGLVPKAAEPVPAALPGNGRTDAAPTAAVPVAAPGSAANPAAPVAAFAPTGATAKSPVVPAAAPNHAPATAKMPVFQGGPSLMPQAAPAAVPVAPSVASPAPAGIPVAATAAPAPPQAKAPAPAKSPAAAPSPAAPPAVVAAPPPKPPAPPPRLATPPVGSAPKPAPTPPAPPPVASAAKPAPAPAAPLAPAPKPSSPPIDAAPEAKAPLPESAPSASPPGQTLPSTVDDVLGAGVPFWLDFGVPVGSGALFLFLLWVVSIVLVWKL